MTKEHLKIAYENMKTRKLRSFLTLIGILIAITTIFVLISLSLGLRDAVQEQFRLLGTDKLFIQPKGAMESGGVTGTTELTRDDVDIIKKISGVKRVASSIVENVMLENNGQVRFTFLIGLNEESASLFFESSSIKIDMGRFIRDGEKRVINIGSDYKTKNLFGRNIEVGDNIVINGTKFNVKGIVAPIGNPQDDRQIYMNEDELREFFGISNRVDIIIVQVEQGENVAEIGKRIEKKLVNSRNVDEKNPDFAIMSPEELLATFGKILDILTAFLLGIGAISVIVGAIGVANTMFTSVLERTKEIGVMKAIGAQSHDITMIFLFEAGLLGLVGGIAGVVLGWIIGKIIEFIALNYIGTNLLAVSTPWYLFAGCLLFSFLVGALAGIWPTRHALKVKPVEALRYE